MEQFSFGSSVVLLFLIGVAIFSVSAPHCRLYPVPTFILLWPYLGPWRRCISRYDAELYFSPAFGFSHQIIQRKNLSSGENTSRLIRCSFRVLANPFLDFYPCTLVMTRPSQPPNWFPLIVIKRLLKLWLWYSSQWPVCSNMLRR